MRTPGQDEVLFLGFLHSEGIIDSIDDVAGIDSTNDTITAYLTDDAHFEPNEHIRRTTITSSCGICGKDSISNLLHIHGPPLSESIRVNQQDVSFFPQFREDRKKKRPKFCSSLSWTARQQHDGVCLHCFSCCWQDNDPEVNRALPRPLSRFWNR